jgi:RHS repeat-associated protein
VATGDVLLFQDDVALPGVLGHVTHLWYDEYDRVTARADPLGRLTHYRYDDQSNLISRHRTAGHRRALLRHRRRPGLWGGTLWHPTGAATPLRFTGQYHDPEIGLHYNHRRYYDPVTGSYLTPDPFGLGPAPNPHAFVPNPLLQTDPLGLMSCGPKGDSKFDFAGPAENPACGPSFIVKSNGEVVRLPDGAIGPIPVRAMWDGGPLAGTGAGHK